MATGFAGQVAVPWRSVKPARVVTELRAMGLRSVGAGMSQHLAFGQSGSAIDLRRDGVDPVGVAVEELRRASRKSACESPLDLPTVFPIAIFFAATWPNTLPRQSNSLLFLRCALSSCDLILLTVCCH